MVRGDPQTFQAKSSCCSVVVTVLLFVSGGSTTSGGGVITVLLLFSVDGEFSPACHYPIHMVLLLLFGVT